MYSSCSSKTIPQSGNKINYTFKQKISTLRDSIKFQGITTRSLHIIIDVYNDRFFTSKSTVANRNPNLYKIISIRKNKLLRLLSDTLAVADTLPPAKPPMALLME